MWTSLSPEAGCQRSRKAGPNICAPVMCGQGGTQERRALVMDRSLLKNLVSHMKQQVEIGTGQIKVRKLRYLSFKAMKKKSKRKSKEMSRPVCQLKICAYLLGWWGVAVGTPGSAGTNMCPLQPALPCMGIGFLGCSRLAQRWEHLQPNPMGCLMPAGQSLLLQQPDWRPTVAAGSW